MRIIKAILAVAGVAYLFYVAKLAFDVFLIFTGPYLTKSSIKEVPLPANLTGIHFVLENDAYLFKGDPKDKVPLDPVIENEIARSSEVEFTAGTLGPAKGRETLKLEIGKKFDFVKVIGVYCHYIGGIDFTPELTDFYLILKDENGVFYRVPYHVMGQDVSGQPNISENLKKGLQPFLAYYINDTRQGFFDDMKFEQLFGLNHVKFK